MPATKTFWWNDAPFLRLIPFLILGIAAGWYLSPAPRFILLAGAILLLPVQLYPFLKAGIKYRLRAVAGASLLLLQAVLGALLVHQQDIRNHPKYYAHFYKNGEVFVAALDEIPVKKPNSLKAVARITHIVKEGQLLPVKGKAIIYFQKEAAKGLTYGSRILLRKALQPVQNSGNPGAFDYRRYCLFQGTTHQVYLQANEFQPLPGFDGNALQQLLIKSRLKVVSILQRYIQSPQERGLAEALLIGYKDDLDKGLVQAYSNTGVVHIIAISGLHLGVIYVLLLFLARPLRRRGQMLQFLFVVGGLWAFTLLAGAQPSVVRSAVMFTCMALGKIIARRSSPLNTLAFSAFGLLCYNPFWLWDLGFQLSYTAVAGILLFHKPLYRQLYFPNKVINGVWNLMALTLTAQILTLPISLYHFHQFPTLFLITNLLAVPLSSLVLYLEIALCSLHFIPPLAEVIGWLTEAAIRFLNNYIVQLSNLPFALWDGFSLSVLQVALLYATIGFTAWWLLSKVKRAPIYALLALLIFSILRTHNLLQAAEQKRLIVYHVPRHRAVDFISGQQVFFNGDSSLLHESFERAFHLRPARTLFRAGSVQAFNCSAVHFGGKQIFFYDSASYFPPALPDVLVVSGKARLPRQVGEIKKMQVVLDATVPQYRVRQWQCLSDSLCWPLHNVRTSGAFVMNW